MCFVINELNNKTIILLNLPECRLLLHGEMFPSCNLSRNVLATLWRDKMHEKSHSVT